MGITVMENFDVANVASLAGAPHNIGIASHSGMISYENIKTFTEKGVRRTSYVEISNTYDGSGGAYGRVLRIPLPMPASGQQNDRTYYLSFRARIITGTADPTVAAVSRTLPNVTVGLFGSIVLSQYGFNNPYNVFGVTSGAYVSGGDAQKLRFWAGRALNTNSPQAQFTPDADGWFHIEIFKAPGDPLYTLWLNDFMYKQTLATTNPTGAVSDSVNYLNLYFARSQTYFNGYWGMEITDVIVIDPTTDGQKYRFGSSGRVLSMDYTSDITNNWASDPSATLSHRQMMMVDKNPPDAANILTGTTIGQREQYAMQPIPADFGQYVPAVKVQPRVMNGGAAAHSIDMEMDWGTGLAVLGNKMVAPGGAYDTTPLIITTKPNGDPWTAADFASAKAGFSVKS